MAIDTVNSALATAGSSSSVHDLTLRDEALVIGKRLTSPCRLKTAADYAVRADRLGQEQDLVRVGECHSLIADRKVIPNEGDPAVEAVPALQQDGHVHVYRTDEPAIHAKDIVRIRIDPNSSLRRDVPGPIEAVVAAVGVLDQDGPAAAIDRREIEQQRGPVSLLTDPHSLELIFSAMRWQEELQRRRRQRIRIGASSAVFAVPFAGRPAIHFANVPHEDRLTGCVTSIDVQL